MNDPTAPSSDAASPLNAQGSKPLTDWEPVTRSYRRGVGPLWFISAALVPAAFALGGYVAHAQQPMRTAPRSLPAFTSPATTAAPTVFHMVRTGQLVTVTALAPNEQSANDIADTVRSHVVDAEVHPRVQVDPSAPAFSTPALAAALDGGKGVQGYSIDIVGGVWKFGGTADSDAARLAPETGVRQASSGIVVQNDITVTPAPSSPSSTTTITATKSSRPTSAATTAASAESAACASLAKNVNDLQAKTKVTFIGGDSHLTHDSEEVVEDIVKLWKKCPNKKFTVTGYSDDLGDPDFNTALSADRAARVAQEMTSHGVPGTAICTTGRGPDNPIASNDTEEGRRMNRRVEISIDPEARR